MNILKWILDITIAYFFVLLPSMIIRSDLKFIFLLHSLNDTQVGNNYLCSYVYHKKTSNNARQKRRRRKNTAHVANILSYLLLIDWQWTRRSLNDDEKFEEIELRHHQHLFPFHSYVRHANNSLFHICSCQISFRSSKDIHTSTTSMKKMDIVWWWC